VGEVIGCQSETVPGKTHLLIKPNYGLQFQDYRSNMSVVFTPVMRDCGADDGGK
jgi:hypothetical protein